MKLAHRKTLLLGTAALVTAVNLAHIKLPGPKADFSYGFDTSAIHDNRHDKVAEIALQGKPVHKFKFDTDSKDPLISDIRKRLDCFDRNTNDGYYYKQVTGSSIKEKAARFERAKECAGGITDTTLREKLLQVYDAKKKDLTSEQDYRSGWYIPLSLFLLSTAAMVSRLNEEQKKKFKAIANYLRYGNHNMEIAKTPEWPYALFYAASCAYVTLTEMLRSYGQMVLDNSERFFWPSISLMYLSAAGLISILATLDKGRFKRMHIRDIVEED